VEFDGARDVSLFEDANALSVFTNDALKGRNRPLIVRGSRRYIPHQEFLDLRREHRGVREIGLRRVYQPPLSGIGNLPFVSLRSVVNLISTFPDIQTVYVPFLEAVSDFDTNRPGSPYRGLSNNDALERHIVLGIQRTV
jgi:hypothetical protein